MKIEIELTVMNENITESEIKTFISEDFSKMVNFDNSIVIEVVDVKLLDVL
tara:strand:+ start:133 stop:285 length:153 start_codon:yes stop_codon:yes gene_type:complete